MSLNSDSSTSGSGSTAWAFLRGAVLMVSCLTFEWVFLPFNPTCAANRPPIRSSASRPAGTSPSTASMTCHAFERGLTLPVFSSSESQSVKTTPSSSPSMPSETTLSATLICGPNCPESSSASSITRTARRLSKGLAIPIVILWSFRILVVRGYVVSSCVLLLKLLPSAGLPWLSCSRLAWSAAGAFLYLRPEVYTRSLCLYMVSLFSLKNALYAVLCVILRREQHERRMDGARRADRHPAGRAGTNPSGARGGGAYQPLDAFADRERAGPESTRRDGAEDRPRARRRTGGIAASKGTRPF